ncbi:hypothetical protein ACJMK2_037601 [Sinanodonta woodiana]|uniref:C-type lectin domain-containing protein n=1 Tax=Sinanodonta woodiana TaxID=1069815 RepID=A0ABD3WKY9_SINWO
MRCVIILRDLITVTFVFFSPGVHGACDPLWHEFGDHCYYVGMKTSNITWIYSENECLSMGGHLASIESTSEHTAISDYLTMYSFTMNEYAWIGLNDIASETKWVWSDGTIYNSSVSRWHSGQPNNGGGLCLFCNQDCVALLSDICDRKWWYDRECSGSFYVGGRAFFVCKKAAVKTTDQIQSGILDTIDTNALTQACDPMWQVSGDHCYYVGFKYSSISWEESEKECMNMNGHLASIESASEYKTILGYLMPYSLTINDYAWIGLNDIVSNWKWVWSDGTVYNSSVSRWKYGQPDDGKTWYLTLLTYNQDCVALVSGICEMEWDDRECSGSFYVLGSRSFFICKKGASPTTQSIATTKVTTVSTVKAAAQKETTVQNSMETGATNEATSGSSTMPVGSVTIMIQNADAVAAISTYTAMTKTEATITGAILSTIGTRSNENTLVESSTSIFQPASFTEIQPTINTKCSCRCSSLLRNGNMTRQELASFVQQLTEELTVNKSTLSSTRRKLTSAQDERPSSFTIGSTFAIVVMCFVFCPIVILDILRCIKFIWN